MRCGFAVGALALAAVVLEWHLRTAIVAMQDAVDTLDAKKGGRPVCPACAAETLHGQRVSEDLALWTEMRERAWANRIELLERELLSYRRNATESTQALGAAMMENRKLRAMIKRSLVDVAGSGGQQQPGLVDTQGRLAIARHRVGVVPLDVHETLVWSCDEIQRVGMNECVHLRHNEQGTILLANSVPNDCTGPMPTHACGWASDDRLNNLKHMCERLDLASILLLGSEVRLCPTWMLHIHEASGALESFVDGTNIRTPVVDFTPLAEHPHRVLLVSCISLALTETTTTDQLLARFDDEKLSRRFLYRRLLVRPFANVASPSNIRQVSCLAPLVIGGVQRQPYEPPALLMEYKHPGSSRELRSASTDATLSY